MSHLVSLREATLADAESIVALWAGTQPGESRDPAGVETSPSSVAEAREAMEFNASCGQNITLAIDVDGEVLGAVITDVGTASPISSTRVLIVRALRVRPTVRRRHVESMLMGHVADLAHERNCEVVISASSTQDRDANRLLAKLGFTQNIVVRNIATSKLSARLSGHADHTSRETSRLVAVRRTMRRRQNARTTPA